MLAAVIITPFAWAAEEKSPLTSLMEAYNVVKGDDGKENFVKTDRILPGQTIEYVLNHKNISHSPLKGVKIVGPIPESCTYIKNSATHTLEFTPLFSIDKGATYSPEPVKYKVKLSNGKEEERIATPDMYTHICWKVGVLAPDEKSVQHYRVMIK